MPRPPKKIEKCPEGCTDLRTVPAFVVYTEGNPDMGWLPGMLGFPCKILDKKPTADEISKLIGGMFALVRLSSQIRKSGYYEAYVDDEGMCKNLEYNPDISAMTWPPQTLFGPGVVIRKIKKVKK